MDKELHKPLKDMTHDALHDLVHFDKKFFKTLPILLFKPGLLTQKAFTEEGKAYVKPFALFVFLNFLFFIVKFRGIFAYKLEGYRGLFDDRINAASNEMHLSLPLLTERFNMAMHFEQKEYLIIMVPLFAILVQLLFINKRQHYLQHLVFSLHFYSFFIIILILLPFIMLATAWLISYFNGHAGFMYTEVFFIIILQLVTFVYLLFAVRRFYLNNWAFSIIKSVILSAGVYFLIVYVFRVFLFFAVMHTITEG
jgi:hypothetical protein